MQDCTLHCFLLDSQGSNSSNSNTNTNMNININANMYYNNSINEHINRVTSVRGHS